MKIRSIFTLTLSAPMMVLYAAILHLVWATTFYINEAAGNGTGLHAVSLLVPVAGLLPLLILASIAALIGAFFNFPGSHYLLLPQQVLLLISATGAITAMWLGHFADGVERSHAFIIADQAYVVLTAVSHTLALVFYYFSKAE